MTSTTLVSGIPRVAMNSLSSSKIYLVETFAFEDARLIPGIFPLSGDGAVTFEEFWAAPKINEGPGCNPNLPPVDVPLDDDDVDDANDVIDEEEDIAN